mgnify:CR=1 FL=1
MNNKKYPKPSSGGFFSTLSGLIIALALLFLLLGADQLFSIDRIQILSPMKSVTQISWELTKNKSELVKEFSFIEANPDVMENDPENSKLLSFKNQQAANPEDSHTKINSHVPISPGKLKTTKIVNPQKYQDSLGEIKVESNPKTSSQVANKQQAKPKGLLKTEKPRIDPNWSKDEGSFSIAEKEKKRSKIVSLIKPAPKNDKLSLVENKNIHSPNKTFAYRPKVSPSVINGPVLRSATLAPRVGTIAVECRLHPYGVYVQQMLQAIEEQWGQLVRGSIEFIRREKLPNKVTYQFILTVEGRIERLTRLDNQENSLASDLCRQSISSRSPFGEWSAEMIHDFGESDLITIHFNYN